MSQYLLARFLRASLDGDSALVRLRRAEDREAGGVAAAAGEPRTRFDGVLSSRAESLGLTRLLFAASPTPMLQI